MANTEEIKFEVVEDYGVIATKGDWELKLQKGSWNGKDPKYDIRAWKGDKCGKGATFTDEELKGLYEKLKELDKKGIFNDAKEND